MIPSALAVTLERVALELDLAARAAAEPLEDLAREARAVAELARRSPAAGVVLPELLVSLTGSLERPAGSLLPLSGLARVGSRLTAARRLLTEDPAP